MRAIEMIERLDLARVQVTGHLRAALRLRDRFSAGDAFYVLLALDRGATLLTSDGPLARAAQGVVRVAYVAR